MGGWFGGDATWNAHASLFVPQIEIVKVDAKADAKVKVVEAEKPEKKVEVVKADAKAEAKAEVRFIT
jgi:hypothetical protein